MGRLTLALGAVAVLLLVLVVGLVASPLVAPWLPQALGVAPATERLEAEVGTIQQKLGDLDAALAESRRTADAAHDQAGQVADLRRTLDDLQRRVQGLGGLTGQMDQLDRQVRAMAQPDAALSDRVDELHARAGELQSHADEVHQRLQSLEAQAGPDPALQQRLDGIDREVTAVSRLADSIQRRMGGMDNVLTGLQSHTDAMERRIAGMDERIAAAARPSPELTEALSALRDRVAGIDRDLGEAGSRIAALRTDLDRNVAHSREVEDRETGRNRWYLLFLNLRQIETGMAAGAPFAREASTLPDLLGPRLSADAGVRSAIAVLQAHGQSGVASIDALASEFGALAAQALRQRPQEQPEPGLWDRLVEGASGLVSIRPVGEVSGDSPGAILARAEAALANRNLARAVTEVEKLTGPPVEAMAGWLGQARARLAVAAALDSLNDAVAAAMLPATPAAPAPTEPAPAEAAPAEPAPAESAPAPQQPASDQPPAPAQPAPADAPPAETAPAAPAGTQDAGPEDAGPEDAGPEDAGDDGEARQGQ